MRPHWEAVTGLIVAVLWMWTPGASPEKSAQSPCSDLDQCFIRNSDHLMLSKL